MGATAPRPNILKLRCWIDVESLSATLENYGADPDAICLFGSDTPELLAYTSLVAAKANDPALAALCGVYEWQNTPLVFLVEGDQITSDQDLQYIRRKAAMRGDAPYLGVVRPGQLTIYRISLDNDPTGKARIDLKNLTGEKRAIIPYLSNYRPGVAPHARQWISKVVLTLLSDAIDELKSLGATDSDAISLVGRALFTRFLLDRDLIPSSVFPTIHASGAAMFDTPADAAKSSNWLDATFNGDFLPLSPGLFTSISPTAFRTLGNILRRAPRGQLVLGWEERWENLDFAYIPVGVLSQAYEHYLRKHAPQRQRSEGGYYTPRIIADMIVRGAFHALRREGVSHSARVLDPAAGAGVFLIAALRELVAERWRHDGKRPDTQTLRNILYTQVTGFDVNESALRFAALGLYLACIELDPNPEPVEKLGFNNLRDVVLHNVGGDDGKGESGFLGSLGNRVGEVHAARYDLVFGNPPWASGTQLPEWSLVRERVRRIARDRVPHGADPKLPNEVLDLPFVWRAMEWAKPGGQIALALHARLLFQHGDGMEEARSAIFQSLNVTGVVNGSEIRHTKVWSEISAPFCLLFARNEVPPPGAGFRFVTPRIEDALNGAGGLRIDASNAEMVTSDQVVRRPEILKILFRGTPLDLEVYDRLLLRSMGTVDAFWQEKRLTRGHGNGYQKIRSSSRTRKIGDGKPGEPASSLWDLPELTSAAMQTVVVDTSQLATFRQERVHHLRSRDLFSGPLLIVQKSPPAATQRIRVAVADDDLVFNESYYGYSAREHVEGKRLVRYLAMLVGSKCALWHALITSGEFGFERETVEKNIIDRVPAPNFDDLDSSDLKQIDLLFNNLVQENSEAAWTQVDTWIASLSGLRHQDLSVITDTLKFNLPFARIRRAAQARPDTGEIDMFCNVISSELNPWALRVRRQFFVAPVKLLLESPWAVVSISTSQTRPSFVANQHWPDILRLADRSAATEIIFPDPDAGLLWLARLNQARYWSGSQARLVARRIAWEHIDFLAGLGDK